MSKNKLLWIIPIFFAAIALYLTASWFKNQQEIQAANKIVKQNKVKHNKGAKKMNKYDNLKEIHLAGGCFWGLEAYMQKLNGVEDAISGYANGKTENPTYGDLHTSGHAETVKVIYKPEIISLEDLLTHYLRVVNPVSVNKQGNDIGTQYRSGIYYTDKNDKKVIDNILKKEQTKHDKPIAIEVLPLKHFFEAEEYHQDYLFKNPNGYCHIDLSLAEKPLSPDKEPVIDATKYPRPSDAELKKTLTDIQYKVAVQNKTEYAFSNEYWDNFEKGIYVDITTKEPLFSSTDKFESGCGWPSFSKPIEKEVTKYYKDNSHYVERIEVRSRVGDAHLGHVFPDGPTELGGLRYCINSASIRFIKKEDLEKEGYIELKKLFE